MSTETGRAKQLLADDPTIVFARRVVTRPSTGHEDHDSVSEAGFDAALQSGAFAFWWPAHGLK